MANRAVGPCLAPVPAGDGGGVWHFSCETEALGAAGETGNGLAQLRRPARSWDDGSRGAGPAPSFVNGHSKLPIAPLRTVSAGPGGVHG